MIVPDRIEEAYDRVDEYFTEHLKLSFDTPEGVTKVLNELIHDHGESVRKALYSLLCEPDSALRKMTTSLLAENGKSAVGQLVPVLVAQFALAPAVALLVATLVIRALASGGENAVCEGMILQHRKVSRATRAKAHAKATSAAPKARRSTVSAGTQKEGVRRKKPSPGSSSAPKDNTKSRKPSPANANKPARKPASRPKRES